MYTYLETKAEISGKVQLGFVTVPDIFSSHLLITHFRLYLFHVKLIWAKSVHLMYAPCFVSLEVCYLTTSSFATINKSSSGGERRTMKCGWNETDTERPCNSYMERKLSWCRSVHIKNLLTLACD